MNSNGWIKLSEREPKLNSRVLIYDGIRHMMSLYSYPPLYALRKDVCYWQPLPEPPKPEPEPLPCPFCGCSDIYVTQERSDGTRQACCSSCLTRSAEYINRDAAVAAWNRRAGGDSNE
jgi:Lar family restriction alleviation protein